MTLLNLGNRNAPEQMIFQKMIFADDRGKDLERV